MAEERNENIANPASEKEKEGEGAGARNTMERGSGQQSKPERPLGRASGQREAGITNRPLPEEEENQARVPPRGETR